MDSLKVTAVKKNQSNDRTEMTVAGNELRVKRRDGSRGRQLRPSSSPEVISLGACPKMALDTSPCVLVWWMAAEVFVQT